MVHESQEVPGPEPAAAAAVDPATGPAAVDPPEVGDPHDGWEPGLPRLRAIAPSAIGGAVVPLGVYYLVRPHVHSDAVALAIAGIPAAAFVASQFVRRHRIDPIGAIVLSGFVIGLIVSFAMGGNAYVLKVRDAGFTLTFGVACIVSAKFGARPLTYYVGRALSAGTDRRRAEIYDQLWETAPARATFRLINLVWGIGLVVEACFRLVLAAQLPTKTFLAVAPVVSFAFLGSMGAMTFWLVRRSRYRATLVEPSDVPVDGGGTWWWLRVYLRPAPVPVPAERRPPEV